MDDFTNSGGRRAGQEQDALMQEISSAAARCSGGEEALIREIYAVAEARKKNGTLSNAEIDGFVAQLSPMLGDAKRKKLQELAQRLKLL